MTTIKFCSDSLCLCNVVGVTFYDNASEHIPFCQTWCMDTIVWYLKKKKTFLGRQHTLLLIPDREPMTDHNTDTVKVQWVLFKLPVGVWVQCYLQEQKWLKDIFITKALKSWAPRAHYIACIGSSTGWRVSFLGSLVSLSLLQAAWLASASFQAARLAFSSFKLFILGREGPSKSVQSQELVGTISCCLFPLLRSFPGKWNVSVGMRGDLLHSREWMTPSLFWSWAISLISSNLLPSSHYSSRVGGMIIVVYTVVLKILWIIQSSIVSHKPDKSWWVVKTATAT